MRRLPFQSMQPSLPLALSLLALASCATTPAPRPAPAVTWQDEGPPTLNADDEGDGIHQTISVHFGGRSLDSDAFDEVDAHGVFGVSVDSYKRGEPFGYEVYLMRSSDTDSNSTREIQATLTEISFGFRGYFETPSPLVAYAGGGLAGVFAESEVLSQDSFAAEDAFSPGFYAHVGLFYPFEDQNLRVGVDYRQMMFTDISFGDGDDRVNGDVDYGQLAIFLGWSF